MTRRPERRFVASVHFDLYIISISVFAFNHCISKESRVARTNGGDESKSRWINNLAPMICIERVRGRSSMYSDSFFSSLDSNSMVMGDGGNMGYDASHVGDDVLALAYIMKKLQMPLVRVNVHLHDVNSYSILC